MPEASHVEYRFRTFLFRIGASLVANRLDQEADVDIEAVGDLVDFANGNVILIEPVVAVARAHPDYLGDVFEIVVVNLYKIL